MRLWNIDKLNELSFKLIKNRASGIYSIYLLQASKHLPINNKNRKFLEKLSDTKLFYISDYCKYLLSQSWISFGDENRAKELYNSINKSIHPQDYKSWDTLLKKYRFNSGQISGVVNGLDKDFKLMLINSDSTIDLNNQFYKIKDIITIKDKFNFTNLLEGNYTLAILLKDDMNITNVKGAKSFNISKDIPIYNEINITIISNKK